MERYQKEMNEIHAPRELIEDTKQKCRQAALLEKTEERKKKKVIPYLIPAVCAALLLIALIPVISTRNTLPETEYDNTQLHLGNYDDTEGKNEEKLIVKKTVIIPIQFLGQEVIKERISDKEISIAVSKEGYYSACIPADDEYVVIESQIRDKEEFMTAVKEIIE